MIRIGVDVGGTFTDVVALDEDSGATSWFKTPTDHSEPVGSVLRAIERSGAPLASVSHVKVGTTLALNAILTRSGAKTGLLTTAGFRDVLEIRRTHRDRLFDLDGPIVRMGAERSPIAFAQGLENSVIPSTDAIRDRLAELAAF